MDTQKDDPFLVGAITAAIAGAENGGKPNLEHLQAGGSGELKSIFQFEPGTWKEASKEAFGRENVPLTPDTETFVEMQRVRKWLQEGKTPQQIFSMQNAGPGEPDAYTGKFSNGHPSIGTNSYGVKYNVPAYVNNAMGYLQKFMAKHPVNGGNAAMTPGAQPTQPTPIPSPTSEPAQTEQEPLVPPVGPHSRSVGAPNHLLRLSS